MRATVALDATSFRLPRQEQGEYCGQRHVVGLAKVEKPEDQGFEFLNVVESMFALVDITAPAPMPAG